MAPVATRMRQRPEHGCSAVAIVIIDRELQSAATGAEW